MKGDARRHGAARQGAAHRPRGLHGRGAEGGAACAAKGGSRMLKDITLGQYFPGDTLAHRLDPRTKLLATVLYIIAIFLAKGPIAYGVLILTLIVSVRISKVGAKALFRGLKPVLFIIAFTAVLNLFYTPGTVIAQLSIFHVTREGVITAIAMMLRISLLIMGTFLLTYTTSPIRLTDGLEDLLGPLKKLGVPVTGFMQIICCLES